MRAPIDFESRDDRIERRRRRRAPAPWRGKVPATLDGLTATPFGVRVVGFAFSLSLSDTVRRDGEKGLRRLTITANIRVPLAIDKFGGPWLTPDDVR